MINKKIYWILGVLLTILGLLFTEGSLLACVKLFGVVKATFIRIVFTIPLSWLAIYLCSKTDASARVRGWFLKKQDSLSRKAKLAVTGGKFFVVLNTTIFLGPILASILMLMLGVQGKRLYVYAALSALLCAWAWSCFYGGVCWGFEKIFVRL